MIGWLIVAGFFAVLGLLSGDSGAYWVALIALLLGPVLERVVRQ